MLTEEAERVRAQDPAMAALLHADAGVTATVAGLCDLVLESAERAIACLPDEAPASVRCQAFSIHGMGLALKGRTAEAAAELDRAGELLSRGRARLGRRAVDLVRAHGTVQHRRRGAAAGGDWRPGRGRPGESVPRDPAVVSAPGGRRGLPPRATGTARSAMPRTRSRTPTSRASSGRSRSRSSSAPGSTPRAAASPRLAPTPTAGSRSPNRSATAASGFGRWPASASSSSATGRRRRRSRSSSRPACSPASPGSRTRRSSPGRPTWSRHMCAAGAPPTPRR